MNKKSAMAIAGGLVAAIGSTLGAVSASLTNGTTPQAQAEPARTAKPIVRTIHRTVTVHKKPKHTPAPVQIVAVAPGSTSTSAPVTHSSGSLAAGHESDDGGEHESGDD